MALQRLTSLGFGGSGENDLVPKALAELQGLTISGPLAGVGASAALTVTGIEAEDTILKVLMFDGTSAIPTDLTAHTTITERRASGTLTLASIAAGDIVSVNGKAYTFVADPGWAGNLGPYQVAVGTTNTLTAANLAVAIMSGDSNILATSSGAVVTIIWRTEGTAGNAKTLAVTASNGHATRSGATLAGGSATATITITDATTSNWVLVFWYNKTA